MTAIYIDGFYEKIKKFVNSDQAAMRNLAFKVFDIEGKDRITMDNLFTFMEIFKKSKRVYGAGEVKNDQLLNLEQIETDIFLEVFKDDFIVLSDAICAKANVKERMKELVRIENEKSKLASKPDEQYGKK